SKKTDPDFAAQIILLPSEQTLAQILGQDVDVDAIHAARERLRASIAAQAKDALLSAYHRMEVTGPYRPDADHAGRRALRNACLGYLAAAPGREGVALAAAQFRDADNMTDSIAALSVLSNIDCPERKEALAAFHDRWKDDHLVMDKWFTIQALSSLPGTLDEVKRLTLHPAFTMKNPNKVRALVTSFAATNQLHFHAADGAGYRFVADKVLDLDRLSPQVGARMLGAFKSLRQMEPKRRKAMQKELKRSEERRV